jgi:hypothetical protein
MNNRNQAVIKSPETFISSMQQCKLVRCAFPDCSWEFKVTGLVEIHNCYDAFREHCIEMHKLDPDDWETMMSLDTNNWMMQLRIIH